MIFAGDFRYELHHNALGPNHLRLVDSLADETVWSSGGVLSVAAAEVAAGGLETLASVYLFTSEKPRGFLSWSWPSSDRLQRLAAVTTDYSEYLFSLTGGDKQGKLVSRHTPPLHPTYSLILEVGAAQESSSVSSGYVIHKGEKNEYFSVLLQYFFSNFIFSTDIFDNTAGLILYDFNLPTPFHLHSSQLPVFNLNGTSPAADQASATFFYIEKTEDPGKVRLVPRQKGAGNFSTSFKSDRQLFSGGGSSPPPIGCKLGDRLYLLDVHLGCVYILSGQLSQLGSFPKNGGGGKTPPGFLLLNRTNVPFESFFLCDPLFFPKSKAVLKLDHNRCAKNVYVSEAEKAKIELQRRQLYQKIGIGVAAVALGILFLISVLITCYCCCCSKSGPSNSKNELKNEQGKQQLQKKSSAPKTKKKTKKGSKTPATSTTKTPTSNSSSKSPAATTTTGAKQNSGKTPSHSTTTSTSTTTPKEQSSQGTVPILPPLGTPATAPPEGRAPFQERVKATAQAIAVRAPPPPPPKVASKVEAAAADKEGGGVPGVSKTAKLIVDNVSSGKSLGE